jgi:hypothetical protein
MEKISTLLWILFAIGAFVFRMIKKAQDTSARESQERPTRPGGAVPGLPASTFQELLKQMQARNAAPSPPEDEPAPPPPKARRTLGGRPMPQEVARPARSQERTSVRQTSLEAPATARARYAPAPPARRSSAMPRASTEAASSNAGPAPVRPAASINATVRQWLSQPESVRAAFVLSEILKRRSE